MNQLKYAHRSVEIEMVLFGRDEKPKNKTGKRECPYCNVIEQFCSLVEKDLGDLMCKELFERIKKGDGEAEKQFISYVTNLKPTFKAAKLLDQALDVLGKQQN